jgi:hypothetical protein
MPELEKYTASHCVKFRHGRFRRRVGRYFCSAAGTVHGRNIDYRSFFNGRHIRRET